MTEGPTVLGIEHSSYCPVATWRPLPSQDLIAELPGRGSLFILTWSNDRAFLGYSVTEV